MLLIFSCNGSPTDGSPTDGTALDAAFNPSAAGVSVPPVEVAPFHASSSSGVKLDSCAANISAWLREAPYPNAPKPLAADYSNTGELGQVLYTKYVYPFELAAVLLLVAIVAAIVLTMRKRKGLKVQDIAAQVATRAEDRVRIIKMKAETRE